LPAFSVDEPVLDSVPSSTAAGRAGPAMRGLVLIRSHDGRVRSGVWDCGPGVFEVTFKCDEVVHILEGEVIVRSNDGAVRWLGAGDVALFQSGLTTTWDVPRYVRKLWFHHDPFPTLQKRIAYKVMLLKQRLLTVAERFQTAS
jgi:uncharacterized cupin superfamily protein